MKTKILLFAFSFAFALSSIAGNKKPVPVIGYLVAIESKTEGLDITLTIDLIDVYTLAEIHFSGNCVDFASELQQSVYYQAGGQSKTFYVELKRINRNGKFRRLSNRQFREIVQAQNHTAPDTKTASNQNN